MVKVVLVYRGKNIPSRMFDRVPMEGETIVIGRIDQDDCRFLYVKEVFWREDGTASLLLSDEREKSV